MKIWTEENLIQNGYEIKNARITRVDISTRDYASAVLELTLDGDGWGVVYGGYKLATAGTCLRREEIESNGKGFESILNIMWVIGVDSFSELKGKYVRVATKGWGDSVKIIGNILKDEWFDYEKFFECTLKENKE